MSNTYLHRGRTTLVRSFLFQEKILSPLPQRTTNTAVKKSSSKLPYGTALAIAQWNVENIKQASLHQQIVLRMKEHNWHIMFLSETCLTDCTHYFVDGYEFYFSSDIEQSAAGVGVVVSPFLRPFLTSFTAHSSRICEVSVAIEGSQLRLFGLYAPTQKDGAEARADRARFWREVTQLVRPIPATTPFLLVGDLNTRLQGRLLGEENIVGPHVFGFWYRRAATQGQDTNRHHLIDLCGSQGLCVANTFKTPNPTHRVTYREIWATEPSSLNPAHHQTLDHVVCPKPWLPMIHSCRSYAHIFNMHASHHAPVVTRISVKLGARKQKPPAPCRLQWPKAEEGVEMYAQYNDKVRAALKDTSESTPDVCASDTPRQEMLFDSYTDGGCEEQRRVSARSKAGWGFFVQDAHRNPITTMYGPVVVDLSSPLSLWGPGLDPTIPPSLPPSVNSSCGSSNTPPPVLELTSTSTPNTPLMSPGVSGILSLT